MIVFYILLILLVNFIYFIVFIYSYIFNNKLNCSLKINLTEFYFNIKIWFWIFLVISLSLGILLQQIFLFTNNSLLGDINSYFIFFNIVQLLFYIFNLITRPKKEVEWDYSKSSWFVASNYWWIYAFFAHVIFMILSFLIFNVFVWQKKDIPKNL